MKTTKTAVRVGSLGLLALSMVACQQLSLPSLNAKFVQSPTTPQLTVSDVPANDALTQAVKATLRSSFSYRTTVSYDNGLREKALAGASAEQLAQSDDFLSACEHQHDEGYVALAKRAIDDGVDISSDRYIDDRNKLKDDFLACKSKFEEQMDETAGELDVPKGYGNYTALDVKKAQLLKDYWLDNTSVSVTGNYQPLKGVVTALPTAQYQSKNAHLMLNQPMVLDIRAGKLLLWADNLALANATTLDKELGLAWRDKWLSIPLNDGSLPDDFVKTLAKELTNSRLSAGRSLKYLDEQGFVALLDSIKTDNRSLLLSANQVIGEQHAKNDGLQSFYQAMTSAYPVLLEKPTDPEKVELNSKTLMQRAFALLKKRLDKTIDTDQATYLPTSYYGIKNGTVIWHYHQNHLAKDGQVEPLQVGVLTELSSKVLANPFPRLPVPHQMPNADNQVDLLKYSNGLIDKLRKDDDVSAQLVARTFLAVLVGFDAPIGVEAESEAEVPEGETNQDF